MENRSPKVSVIIPTRERPGLLRLCLDSLSRVDYPFGELEIIVVSYKPQQEKVIIEEILRKNNSLDIKLLVRNEGDPRPSASRNLGIRHAQGQLLAFTDDDCQVNPCWIKHIAAGLASGEAGAVGGPDFSAGDDPLVARCIDYSFNCFLGTAGIRKGKGLRLTKYYPRSFNMAISRQALYKAGSYFSEEFFPGEDIELCYRIKNAGFRLIYLSHNGVRHLRRGKIRDFWKQVYSRGYARILIAKKHPGLLEPVHLLPVLVLFLIPFLIIISFKSLFVLYILLASGLIYSLGLILSGIMAIFKIKDLRSSFIVPFLIVIQHLGYALGVSKGLAGRPVFQGRLP